jgi:NAD(P)-dependent dehydrogenase (short-subunit alcohol dehydrogenase family)
VAARRTVVEAGVALVTGAGTGVGRAVARALVGAGWRVGFAGRREALLREAVAEAGGGLALPCDVTQPRDVEEMVARVAAEWGRLDLLFNNAGAGAPWPPSRTWPSTSGGGSSTRRRWRNGWTSWR